MQKTFLVLTGLCLSLCLSNCNREDLSPTQSTLSKSTKTTVSTLEKFDDVIAYLDTSDYSVVSQPSWYTLPTEFTTADTIIYYRSNINGDDYKVVIGHKDPNAPINSPAAVKCDKLLYRTLNSQKKWIFVCDGKGSSCYIETVIYMDPMGGISTVEVIRSDCSK